MEKRLEGEERFGLNDTSPGAEDVRLLSGCLVCVGNLATLVTSKFQV